MQALKSRFKYLFTSTKGLILWAIAFVMIITALWMPLSGPMISWGIRDIAVDIIGYDLVHSEREGRLVMLYHSIAMAVVAIVVYMITGYFKMEEHYRVWANATVTVGYHLAAIFGMWFAYFGHNWTHHALYLFGLSLVFFAGMILAVALWPWQDKYKIKDPKSPYGHTKSGLDLERTALWVLVIAMLGSAALGAWAGAYFGNGFEAFLAEDTIRHPYKTLQQKAVIGHLHIMLALIAMSLPVILSRWYDFKGILHNIGMRLMIFGGVVITLGAWSVTVTPHAHTIIYFGATASMMTALFLVIYGFDQLIKNHVKEEQYEKPTFGQKFKGLFKDPLKFGPLWQMIYFNFTMSGVGIFMAVKLSDIFRVWPHSEERIVLVGHWHVLSGIVATIIILWFADVLGLRGKVRKWFGWSVIIGSDIAFGAVTIYEMKRLFTSEYMEQPVINATWLAIDIGLGLTMLAVGAFLVWRLVDLFKHQGMWTREVKHELGFEPTPTDEMISGETGTEQEVSQ